MINPGRVAAAVVGFGVLVILSYQLSGGHWLAPLMVCLLAPSIGALWWLRSRSQGLPGRLDEIRREGTWILLRAAYTASAHGITTGVRPTVLGVDANGITAFALDSRRPATLTAPWPRVTGLTRRELRFRDRTRPGLVVTTDQGDFGFVLCPEGRVSMGSMGHEDTVADIDQIVAGHPPLGS